MVDLVAQLRKQLGRHGSILQYGQRFYIVRFLDDGKGAKLRHPTTVEVYNNPRPWTRKLEVLGAASTLVECNFILRGGSARAMVGKGLTPKHDGKNWTGFRSHDGSEVPLQLGGLLV